MKNLLKRWKVFLKEGHGQQPDLGSAFPKLSVKDIIVSPAKNTNEKIAILNIFTQLAAEKDNENIDHILYSLYTMSGNSTDFKFKSRDDALKFYLAPYQYKAHPDDIQPTKSLKDYHELLKSIVSQGGIARSEIINNFYSSEETEEAPLEPVDPLGPTLRKLR